MELAELRDRGHCERRRIRRDRVRIDPSVVRGLEYYTGPVYEVELPHRDQGRKRPPGALRLGRRRRALRRPRVALPRRAGAGDRLLHRRLALAGGAHRARQARRQKADAGPVRGHGVRPRPHRRLPENGRRACATPASAPSFISAIPRHAVGQQLKYADRAVRLAPSSRAPTKRPKARCRSRT